MLIRTSAAAPAGPARPTPTLLHSSTDLRLLVFNLAPGQQVAPHSSRSTVVLTVLAGHGTLQNGEAVLAAGPGDLTVVEPRALHGFTAGDEPMTVLAAIAPCP